MTEVSAQPDRYNHKQIEEKWQQKWQQAAVFSAPQGVPAKPYYVLEMFPYPSGNIHMGHVRNYAIGDVVARFRKAQGYDVLHPMGWDAFGLPAENAAISRGVHPRQWTESNIETMRSQLQSMGLSYDWAREIATCRPEYFKHEQKFFLEFLKKDLAYRKETLVNWDPVENTVLANEQVIDGRGWRSGALVEKKKLYGWFLKITKYAEELLADAAQLENWPEKVRLMQEKWIGKSVGAEIHFSLSQAVMGYEAADVSVFSTRPDTLFGAAFVAISPDHPLAAAVARKNKAVADFVVECQQLGTSEVVLETQEKKGVFTGLTVAHPFITGKTLPVYVANFVLMEYGTGAVFGCPAHDARDLEFAIKYQLPIVPVVLPTGASAATFSIDKEAYTGDGVLFNSDFLNDFPVAQAKQKAIAVLEEKQAGSGKTTYRLRDWGVSRQRYWGCPIPVIHCDSCGIVPVPEEQLPVCLPEDVDFSGTGNPLEKHPTWKHVNCPECGKPAVRETDTFDTFFESSWYFMRFTAPHSEKPIENEIATAWLPVNQYIGGVEHAVLHLLYARFFTKALRDCGYIAIDEPFQGLLTQGMVCHATFKTASGAWVFPQDVVSLEDGTFKHLPSGESVVVGRAEKMSKSLKNVVDPAYIIETYGADTARLFMLSDSPPERDIDWTDSGVEGAWRYGGRLYRLVQQAVQEGWITAAAPIAVQHALYSRLHTTIAAVTDDLTHCRMNRAVARIRELSNAIEEVKPQTPEEQALLSLALRVLVQLIAPMMPHLAEELWQLLGQKGFVCLAPWPYADEKVLAAQSVTISVQVNGKLRATFSIAKGTSKETLEATALAAPTVQKSIADTPIRKVIVVPDRIVNVVI